MGLLFHRRQPLLLYNEVMSRKVVLSIVVCIFTLSSLFAAPYVSLVYYVPKDDADYYESTSFSIGVAPFDFDESSLHIDQEDSFAYSPLSVLDSVDSSDYEPVSMVSDRNVKRNKREKVGSRWKNVSVSVDDENVVTIDATCVHECKHAFFYVDDELGYDLDDFVKMGEEFDSCYDKIISVFGTEADVDGNGKIRFLVTEFEEDTMGFYYPLDQYSNKELRKADIDYISNESDVLYVNSIIFSDRDYFDIADVYSTLAHEFSHMAYLNSRERKGLMEESSMWITEGLAMWCEYYVGLPVGHDEYIGDYIFVSDEIGLFEEEKSEIYGLGLLFFRYIEESFGLESIIDIVNSEYVGTDAISDAIGYSFEDIFVDFAYCLLATATNTHDDFYLPLFNDYDNGFVFSDEVMNIISDSENWYNLEGGYSYHNDNFNPFSICFFLSSGIPDFESEKANIVVVEL